MSFAQLLIRTTPLVILVFATPLFLLGCDGKENSSAKVATEAVALHSVAPASVEAAPAIPHNALFGTWSVCKPGAGRLFVMLDHPIRSQETIYDFDDANVTITVSSFASGDCSGDSAFDYVVEGNYAIGAKNANFPEATDLQPSFPEPALITVNDDSVAGLFAIQEFCKNSVWNVNDPVPASAACNSMFENQLRVSNIFAIKNSTLHFGNSRPVSETNDSQLKPGLILDSGYTLQ